MRFKTILIAIGIVAAGVGLLRVMANLAEEPPEVVKREPEFAVLTAVAAPAAYRPFLSIIGTVEAQASADLVSPVESSVLELNYEEGDAIERGASAVVLDTRDLHFQIEAQQANIDNIQAQIDALQIDRRVEAARMQELRKLEQIAQDDLGRSVRLRERGVVSAGAVDQARTAVSQRGLEILSQQQKIQALELSEKQLAANLRAGGAQLGLLRLTLERARLEAPWDGIVREIMTTAGTDVPRGATLARIYDPASVRLRAAIPSSIAATVRDLSGTLRYNGGAYELELISIAPEAKQGRGSTSALFALPAGNWLLGSALEFDLILPAIAGSVALPNDALYGGSRIYVVDDDQRARAVECSNLGLTRSEGSQLALLDCSGLVRGDKVVVSRIPNLVSGSKLRVEGDTQAASSQGKTAS